MQGMQECLPQHACCADVVGPTAEQSSRPIALTVSTLNSPVQSECTPVRSGCERQDVSAAGQEERRERRRRREQGGQALDSEAVASAAAFDTEPTPPLSDQVPETSVHRAFHGSLACAGSAADTRAVKPAQRMRR